MSLQTVIRALYPAQCMMCETRIEEDHGLCPGCRRETEFLAGAACNCCALPLPGQADEGLLCDGCRKEHPPWGQGRAALVYAGTGRRLVLALKHGDRTDIVPGAARWIVKVAQDLITPKSLLVPIPLHWTRRIKRRYNQSALLAQAISRDTGASYLPDALRRIKRTPKLDGMTRVERQAMLKDVLAPHNIAPVEGAPCVLIDDVMTTGATLSAAAQVLWENGADSVDVLTLARVALDRVKTI